MGGIGDAVSKDNRKSKYYYKK